MKKGLGSRVFARQVAKVLTEADVALAVGQGTSFVGTGCSDAQGRSSDMEGYDCADQDTYTPAPRC